MMYLEAFLYLLKHRCEYTTGIIERGCGREANKARGGYTCRVAFRKLAYIHVELHLEN